MKIESQQIEFDKTGMYRYIITHPHNINHLYKHSLTPEFMDKMYFHAMNFPILTEKN